MIKLYQVRRENIMWLTDIFKINDFKSQIQSLKRENAALSSKLSSLEGENYFSIQGKVGELNNCYDQRLQESQTLSVQIRERFEKVQELDKQIMDKQRMLTRMKEMYEGIESSVQNYRNTPLEYDNHQLDDKYLEECEKLAPSIRLTNSCMNDKALHEAYLEKEKIIAELFKQYAGFFTMPSNKAIYDLTVLSLRSEIQNILYGLKNNPSISPTEAVKKVCQKYLKIACEGNHEASEIFTKFIGELEYHLVDLVKIEAQYCEKKE